MNLYDKPIEWEKITLRLGDKVIDINDVQFDNYYDKNVIAFLNDPYKDKHPVTLEPLDTE